MPKRPGVIFAHYPFIFGDKICTDGKCEENDLALPGLVWVKVASFSYTGTA
jgi:hypothetical protein